MTAQTVPVAAVVDNRSIEIGHTAKLLETKLNSALTSAGAHSEKERGLYMVAELLPTSEDVVDTGMKKIKIRGYNLSLRVEYPMLDMCFGSLSLPLEGSGTDDTKAAIAAIRTFDPTSSTTQNFIAESMRKADSYFVGNIDNIIDKADMLAKSGDYDAGLALLWGCPNLPSIHSKVYGAMERLFLLKQSNECSNLIAEARAAYALKNYDEAISLLNGIDAESSCAAESMKLAQKIGDEIRADEKARQAREDAERERQFQIEENQRERKADMERRRISAIENVAVAYLKNHRAHYHYYVW